MKYKDLLALRRQDQQDQTGPTGAADPAGATIIPLIDGALYYDARTARQRMVDAMARHIVEVDCAHSPQDAFQTIVFSRKYDIATAALCFNDAIYLAQQMVVGREMGLQ